MRISSKTIQTDYRVLLNFDKIQFQIYKNVQKL